MSHTTDTLFLDITTLNMNDFFSAFDQNNDDLLSLPEFTRICRALFRNDDTGRTYDISSEQVQRTFAVFDRNQDQFIDLSEFQICWHNWIHPILRPRNAFLVVDMQNDFITGSLAISSCSAKQNAEEIINPINTLVDTVPFEVVFYSLDWHPSDHVSFIENIDKRPLHDTSPVDVRTARVHDTVIFAGPPAMEQHLWPQHCVQNTWGAELHPQLMIAEHSTNILKGCNSEVDSYSMFWDNMKLSATTLNDQLRAKNISDVYVCGVAYDACVGATAMDAIASGYRTLLVDDCCRGIDSENIERTKQLFVDRGGQIVQANQVKAMAAGRDRRPDIGFKLALDLIDNSTQVLTSE